MRIGWASTRAASYTMGLVEIFHRYTTHFHIQVAAPRYGEAKATLLYSDSEHVQALYMPLNSRLSLYGQNKMRFVILNLCLVEWSRLVQQVE